MINETFYLQNFIIFTFIIQYLVFELLSKNRLTEIFLYVIIILIYDFLYYVWYL